MEDKNIYNDLGAIDNNNVSSQNGEVDADVKYDKNNAESEKDMREESTVQEKTDDAKETDPQIESKNDGQEGQNTQEQILEDSVKPDSAEYVWGSDNSSKWGNSSSVYH